MYESESYCSDCQRTTVVVFDHSAGDTICLECGLVVESYSIDETSEWRKFADDSGDGNDPDRVGSPINPLLPNGGLSTFITNTKSVTAGAGGNNPLPLSRNNFVSNPDQAVIQAFEAIASMCDKLGLVTLVKDRAKEIYSKVECDRTLKCERTLKGRNKDAILAACLYIACRKEDKPRTVKEICSVATGVSKKQFGAAKEYVRKRMDAETDHQSGEMGTVLAEDLVKPFGYNLGMNYQQVKAALETVQKSNALDIRRSPLSVAATVIYIITQLSDEKKPIREIQKATGVSESTIKNTFKDMYPNISDLIPRWYANEDQVRKIC